MRKLTSFISESTTLHNSLESSTKMLLANRHEDVVSCFKDRGDRNMDELHPLEKNVYALGLLFSGKKEQAINVQSQVFQRRMWSELNKL
jgi:hypothetical protein